MMRVLIAALSATLLLTAAACSGSEAPTAGTDGTEAAVAPATTEPAADVSTPPEPTPEEPTTEATTPAEAATSEPAAAPTDDAAGAGDAEGELPAFSTDFDRVCTTGVGFGGAATYEQVAGRTHPVLLLEEQDSGLLVESGITLPAGWTIEEDDDFADNSELAGVELVACATVASETPTGVMCELEGEEGEEPITLELVDATYDLTVHAASTGDVVGETTLDASSTECPFFVFIEEGQTTYRNSPTEDQYITALQPYVAP